MSKETITKTINAETVINNIKKIDSKISVNDVDKYHRYFIRHDKTMLGFVMDQKYGVAFRKYEDKKYSTSKITNEDEMKKIIGEIKEKITSL